MIVNENGWGDKKAPVAKEVKKDKEVTEDKQSFFSVKTKKDAKQK